MGLFAKPGLWYPLDVDNRVTPPKYIGKNGEFIGYKPHCCRCNKGLYSKGHLAFKSVDVDWDNMQVRNNPIGRELIGTECWKITIKSNES